MESTPKSLLDGLRFDIFERVHLSESDRNIELIEETELTPQIKMLMHKDTILLEGKLLLKIRYLGAETPWIDNNFEFSIPVEITIPANRVSDAWLLDADIENFNIEQEGSRSLNVTGVLKVYEKEPVRVESLSQERLNLVSAKGLQMIIDFWSDINEVERAPSESIQCDVLAYLEEIKRLQAIEAQYKEALSMALPIVEHQSPATVEFINQILEGANDHE